MNFYFGSDPSGSATTSSVIEQQPLLSPVAAYADVTFKDLHPYKIFYKKQYRKNHVTKQLVVNDEKRWINMEAKTINCQLYMIKGWVRREKTAASLMKDENGDVPIKNEDTGEVLNLIKETDVPTPIENGFLQPFSVDLHEIYEGNNSGPPVFHLSKSDKDRKRNLFQLVIQLEFIDFSKSQKFESPIFNLRTLETGNKRPRRDSDEGASSRDSPRGSVDSGNYDDGVRHPQILVDMLDAKTAKVDNLVAKGLTVNGGMFRVETSNADLAYHMLLKEPEKYGDLQEGDIVGFYEDVDTGETYIQRLRSNNIHNALHAGVVSRSHWLAGHKPIDEATKTDTICVIGIVNVKVVGSVENGERIYASNSDPGKAIPQSHMPVGSFLRKKHVLLGMALETKKSTKILDHVNLVKCFVCIVLDVSRHELLEEIENLYEVNEKRTDDQIKIESKRTWKRLKYYCLAALLFIGIMIFLLYQWLVPGSMFRYWLCRRGSMPNHDMFYHYVNIHTSRHYRVHGIEFTWQGLEDKIGFNFKRCDKCNKSWPIHYYLNVDRCAYYWADGAAGNNIGGRKYIGGSRVFTACNNCTIVYDLVEDDDRWDPVLNQTHHKCIKP